MTRMETYRPIPSTHPHQVLPQSSVMMAERRLLHEFMLCQSGPGICLGGVNCICKGLGGLTRASCGLATAMLAPAILSNSKSGAHWDAHQMCSSGLRLRRCGSCLSNPSCSEVSQTSSEQVELVKPLVAPRSGLPWQVSHVLSRII